MSSRISFARVVTGLAALVLLLSPVMAFAQSTQPSLGEIARREAERRKAIKAPGKVYTDKDKPPAAPGAAALPPPVAYPAGAKPEDEKAEDKKDEKDEAWWRNRITAAREQLRRDEMFIAALQSQINGLSTDFVNRDDPFQRAKIGEDRQKALAEQDRLTKDIADVKKQIADIEEEARRAGVPPGWLR
jgi:hypothetical protein